jgi:hypothetical protein
MQKDAAHAPPRPASADAGARGGHTTAKKAPDSAMRRGPTEVKPFNLAVDRRAESRSRGRASMATDGAGAAGAIGARGGRGWEGPQTRQRTAAMAGGGRSILDAGVSRPNGRSKQLVGPSVSAGQLYQHSVSDSTPKPTTTILTQPSSLASSRGPMRPAPAAQQRPASAARARPSLTIPQSPLLRTKMRHHSVSEHARLNLSSLLSLSLFSLSHTQPKPDSTIILHRSRRGSPSRRRASSARAPPPPSTASAPSKPDETSLLFQATIGNPATTHTYSASRCSAFENGSLPFPPTPIPDPKTCTITGPSLSSPQRRSPTPPPSTWPPTTATASTRRSRSPGSRRSSAW